MSFIDKAYQDAKTRKRTTNLHEERKKIFEGTRKLKKKMQGGVTIFMKTRNLKPLKNEKSYFPGEFLKLFDEVKRLLNKIIEEESKGNRPLNLYENLQKLVWTLDLYNNKLKVENKIKPYTELEFKKEIKDVINIISKHQNIKEGKEKFQIYPLTAIKENPELLVLLFMSKIADNNLKDREDIHIKLHKQIFITRNLKLNENKFKIYNNKEFFSKKNLNNIKKFLQENKTNIKFNIKKYLEEIYGIKINSIKKIYIIKNGKQYYLVNDKILKNFLGLKKEDKILENINKNKGMIFSNKKKKIVRIENLLYCKEEKVRKIIKEILFRGIKLDNGKILKYKELIDKYLIFDSTEIELVDDRYLNTNFEEKIKDNENLDNKMQNTFNVYKIY